MKMKLLSNLELYCIKVDYFMWDEENDKVYTEPMFLAIDTEIKDKKGKPVNIIIFEENITSNLRVFDTVKQAEVYIEKHNKEVVSTCYENERVVKITYDCEKKEWKEC